MLFLEIPYGERGGDNVFLFALASPAFPTSFAGKVSRRNLRDQRAIRRTRAHPNFLLPLSSALELFHLICGELLASFYWVSRSPYLAYRPSDPRKRKQTETKIAVFLLILPPHDKACGTERGELNGSTGGDARALGDLRSGCRVIFGTPSCQRPEGQEIVPLQLESPHEKSSRAKVSLDGPMDTAFASFPLGKFETDCRTFFFLNFYRLLRFSLIASLISRGPRDAALRPEKRILVRENLVEATRIGIDMKVLVIAYSSFSLCCSRRDFWFSGFALWATRLTWLEHLFANEYCVYQVPFKSPFWKGKSWVMQQSREYTALWFLWNAELQLARESRMYDLVYGYVIRATTHMMDLEADAPAAFLCFPRGRRCLSAEECGKALCAGSKRIGLHASFDFLLFMEVVLGSPTF
ncbi:uncharacterized protein CLUP02_00413 [Colletotrichum lupini]|uniref:Uncharacterized protein n=1 Tax=Colletotrichum lupini TaxID=145971 RepID=A0A9Q8SAA3_9PEZI|nr:uncharacterized protein CLUP02_00413 [Colletotrichum lupini]UQC73767.1 hypothetical protein CLUP02_00413 [Colletotrichum lupini]